MIYACCTLSRRNVVLGNPLWNGIDFVEVVDQAAADPADRQLVLEVHFVNPLGMLNLSAVNFRIDGGERIQNIKIDSNSTAAGPQPDVFTVKVEQPGDFSLYTLRLVTSDSDETVPPDIDPQLAAVQFSFKVECPSPFDCAPQPVCPPAPIDVPDIDYLAKDYASFRRLMLDRMAVLMPQWKERNAADIGVVLVEALAYTADQLSYQQDAVATEAYLGTARRRVSVRRHARLMDYIMSEGCNARAWVHLAVSADVIGIAGPAIPAGTKITTQIANQQTAILDDPRVYGTADAIFETIEPLKNLYQDHNELRFYTWSDQRCCLPKGATRATLAGEHPNLKPDMVLIIEEVLGAQTGNPADADPTRRHAVRLTSVDYTKEDKVSPLIDPVEGEEIKITEIVWNLEDALPFPICLWEYKDSVGNIRQVSVARGNIVLADHGLTHRGEALGTVPEPFLFTAPVSGGNNCAPSQPQPILPRFRPQLSRAPLTHSAPAPLYTQSARAAMQWSLRDVRPAITLAGTVDAVNTTWAVQRDLLNSSNSANEYVVEVENDGKAVIRFGDDKHGRRPEQGTEFFATYRIGNGRAGNIGADSLRHIAFNAPGITSIRNPLAATGGLELEPMEDIRQKAPVAYRVQERAVTEDDYAEVTERRSDVQRAAATFRWTGSWHTVFITVDRGVGAQVSTKFERDIRNHVERYRMAGHDLEADSPQFVSLEIDFHVCVAADHFRSDVERELFAVFSNRDLPDGRRGLFHPDNFTFGQPVYLSAIYAAAHQVTGVESVEVRTFQRQGVPESSALDQGCLEIGRLEIVRLDNDRNFAERGQLTISLGGGK